METATPSSTPDHNWEVVKLSDILGMVFVIENTGSSGIFEWIDMVYNNYTPDQLAAMEKQKAETGRRLVAKMEAEDARNKTP